MSGLGRIIKKLSIIMKATDYSQEGNAEIYNEAFIEEAFKIRDSTLQLSGKPDWECRHYLHRKSLARGLRLYLMEMEMKHNKQAWVFPVYSAYDDTAYSEQLMIIDQYRIKVIWTKRILFQNM